MTSEGAEDKVRILFRAFDQVPCLERSIPVRRSLAPPNGRHARLFTSSARHVPCSIQPSPPRYINPFSCILRQLSALPALPQRCNDALTIFTMRLLSAAPILALAPAVLGQNSSAVLTNLVQALLSSGHTRLATLAGQLNSTSSGQSVISQLSSGTPFVLFAPTDDACEFQRVFVVRCLVLMAR